MSDSTLYSLCFYTHGDKPQKKAWRPWGIINVLKSAQLSLEFRPLSEGCEYSVTGWLVVSSGQTSVIHGKVWHQHMYCSKFSPASAHYLAGFCLRNNIHVYSRVIFRSVIEKSSVEKFVLIYTVKKKEKCLYCPDFIYRRTVVYKASCRCLII